MHAFFTMLVAVPSFLTAFTIGASLNMARASGAVAASSGGGRNFRNLDKDRWLFSYLFAGLFIFIFGGVTGVINASYNLNNVVHNTSWLPAHFHQTVAGPIFLAYIGMSLFLVATLTGKEIKLPTWNVWVPYIWTVGHHDFFHRSVHRRRERRTAPDEHGSELHRSAVAPLSARLAGCENARQHRRHDHDRRRVMFFVRFLRHTFQPAS